MSEPYGVSQRPHAHPTIEPSLQSQDRLAASAPNGSLSNTSLSSNELRTVVRHLIGEAPVPDAGHPASRLEMGVSGHVEMSAAAGQARKVAQAGASAQAIASSAMLLLYKVEEELADREDDKQQMEIQLDAIAKEAAELSMLLHHERTTSSELKKQNELRSVEMKGLLECVERTQWTTNAHAAERAEWEVARSALEQRVDALAQGEQNAAAEDREANLQHENSALVKRLAKIRADRSSKDAEIQRLKLEHSSREQELRETVQQQAEQLGALELELQLMKSVIEQNNRATASDVGSQQQDYEDLSMTKMSLELEVQMLKSVLDKSIKRGTVEDSDSEVQALRLRVFELEGQKSQSLERWTVCASRLESEHQALEDERHERAKLRISVKEMDGMQDVMIEELESSRGENSRLQQELDQLKVSLLRDQVSGDHKRCEEGLKEEQSLHRIDLKEMDGMQDVMLQEMGFGESVGRIDHKEMDGMQDAMLRDMKFGESVGRIDHKEMDGMQDAMLRALAESKEQVGLMSREIEVLRQSQSLTGQLTVHELDSLQPSTLQAERPPGSASRVPKRSVSAIQTENSSLREKLDEIRAERSTWDRELHAMLAERSEWEKELGRQISTQQQQVTELELKLETSQAEIRRLQAELNRVNRQLARMHDEELQRNQTESDLNSTNQSLVGEVQQYKALLENQTQIVSELQVQISTKTRTLTQMEHESRVNAQAYAAKQSGWDAVQACLSPSKSSADSAVVVTATERVKSCLKIFVYSIERELAARCTSEEELSECVRSLRELPMDDVLRTELDQSRSAAIQLRLEYEDLLEESDQLKEQELVYKNNFMEDEETIEEQRQEIERLQSDLEQLQQDAAMLEQDAALEAELEAELGSSMAESKQAAEAELVENTTLMQKVAQLQAESGVHETLTAPLAHLALAVAHEVHVSLEEKHSRVLQLELQVFELQQELLQMQQQLEKGEAQVSDIEIEYEEMQKENEALKGENAVMHEASEALKGVNAEMQEASEALNNAMTGENLEMQKANESLKGECAEMQKANEALKGEYADMQQQLDDLLVELEQLNETKDENGESPQMVRDENARLLKEVARLQEESAILEASSAGRQDDSFISQMELEKQCQDQVAELETTVDDLEGQVTDLQAESTKSKQQVEKLQEETKAWKKQAVEVERRAEAANEQLMLELDSLRLQLQTTEAGSLLNAQEKERVIQQLEDKEVGASDKEGAMLEEVEQAITKVLEDHRVELGKQFMELAAKKSKHDRSSKGKKRSIAERVACDLADLLAVANEGAPLLVGLQQQLNKVQAERDELLKEIKQLEPKPAELQEQLNKVQAERDELLKEIKQLEPKLMGLQQQLSQMQAERIEMSTEMSNMPQIASKSSACFPTLALFLLCALLMYLADITLFVLS